MVLVVGSGSYVDPCLGVHCDSAGAGHPYPRFRREGEMSDEKYTAPTLLEEAPGPWIKGQDGIWRNSDDHKKHRNEVSRLRQIQLTEDLLTWLKCTTISACVLIVLVSAHLAVWLIERWLL